MLNIFCISNFTNLLADGWSFKEIVNICDTVGLRNQKTGATTIQPIKILLNK